MLELTQTQRRVFEWVREHLVEGRPAPTVREVAAQFGWSSKRAAECHLEALFRKGWLASDRKKARSLRLTPSAQPRRRLAAEIPIYGTIPAGWGRDRQQEGEACI